MLYEMAVGVDPVVRSHHLGSGGVKQWSIWGLLGIPIEASVNGERCGCARGREWVGGGGAEGRGYNAP